MMEVIHHLRSINQEWAFVDCIELIMKATKEEHNLIDTASNMFIVKRDIRENKPKEKNSWVISTDI